MSHLLSDPSLEIQVQPIREVRMNKVKVNKATKFR